MSTKQCLFNFRNQLKYFAEKMSLLHCGVLFPNFKGKQNNEELCLCLIEELLQLLSLKLERAFCKSNNLFKTRVMSIYRQITI